MTATTSPPGEGGASAAIVAFCRARPVPNYGVRCVLALMIGLLIISIIVIAVRGIEPANRRLEDLETAHG